jgi:hypothetical protein
VAADVHLVRVKLGADQSRLGGCWANIRQCLHYFRTVS